MTEVEKKNNRPRRSQTKELPRVGKISGPRQSGEKSAPKPAPQRRQTRNGQGGVQTRTNQGGAQNRQNQGGQTGRQRRPQGRQQSAQQERQNLGLGTAPMTAAAQRAQQQIAARGAAAAQPKR